MSKEKYKTYSLPEKGPPRRDLRKRVVRENDPDLKKDDEEKEKDIKEKKSMSNRISELRDKLSLGIREFVGSCPNLSARFLEKLMDNAIELEEDGGLYRKYGRLLIEETEWSREDIDDQYTYIYLSKIDNKKYIIFQHSAIEYVYILEGAPDKDFEGVESEEEKIQEQIYDLEHKLEMLEIDIESQQNEVDDLEEELAEADEDESYWVERRLEDAKSKLDGLEQQEKEIKEDIQELNDKLKAVWE